MRVTEKELERQLQQRKNKFLIVVLSFNGIEDTIHCLKSLKGADLAGFDVLVVDNNSTPPVASTLRNIFPEAEIIELQENLGWAGGNNVGINIGLEREYDWICLLNNDTVFPDRELEAWSKTLTNSPPALLHPTIYYWDDPEVAQLKPGYQASGIREPGLQEWNGKILMDYAYGACLAIHRTVFEKIGLFDERLFLQLEETDFYYRAHDAGFVSACDEAVKIFHKESRAFGGKKTPVKTYYIVRNSLLLIEKRNVNFRARLALLKNFYWTVSSTARNDNRTSKDDVFGVLGWCFSRSNFATAVRFGILHYLTRSFGRVSPKVASKLKKPSAFPVNLQTANDHIE